MNDYLIKPHGAPEETTEAKVATRNPGKECAACDGLCDGTYGWNNQGVCAVCYHNIGNDWNGTELRYADPLFHDKYNTLADKYPRIFERDFYKRPDIRKQLKLDEK